MDNDGQKKTKAAYEDPEIVAGYIKKHSLTPELKDELRSFSNTIHGKEILDLGCGPGHDSYLFAELGFHVTGLDYSKAMIHAAKNFKVVTNPPKFIVGDMRELPLLFPENNFDAVWAAASLLHISKRELAHVLRGIHTITQPDGKVYIGVKGGSHGEQLVREDKYGKTMEREFTFWEKDTFTDHLGTNGFTVDSVSEKIHGSTMWLNYLLHVNK